MPGKRSRDGRSSSVGESDFFRQVSTIDFPEALWRKGASSAAFARPVRKFSKPSNVKSTKPRGRILRISSPVREWDVKDSHLNSVHANVGGFLEACYFCNKKISESDEVFMYSYLRAFCSCECRDQQIVLDGGIMTPALDSTERVQKKRVKSVSGASKPQMKRI